MITQAAMRGPVGQGQDPSTSYPNGHIQMQNIVAPLPSPEPVFVEPNHGRHHIERPNAVPVGVFVAHDESRPSGRHRANVLTSSARVISRMVGGVL